MAFYEKAFVHINLNTATPEEILLVPGAGSMVHEFDGPRGRPMPIPWKTSSTLVAGTENRQYTVRRCRQNTATTRCTLTEQCHRGPSWASPNQDSRPANTRTTPKEIEARS